MTTHIDHNVWIIALASKCIQQNLNLAWTILIMASLVWLTTTFYYWSHPGGPAWGKYYYYSTAWRRRRTSSSSHPPTPPIPNTKASSTPYNCAPIINNNNNNIIPGPKGWPLIGSITLMASLAHHRIAAAATACKARRLMAFSMGETRAIVTCHPDVAREILNSSVFVDRPIKESAYSLMFNRAIGFAPYGLYWRTLRRIATTHLFCPKQIKASELQRSKIAKQMVDTLSLRGNRAAAAAGHPRAIRVREVLKRASLSNMVCSVFGNNNNPNVVEMEELRGLVEEGYELLGTLNWGDHLPWLAHFDAQKIRFRCHNLVPKVNRFVSRIIAQHRDRAFKTQTNRDFVDVLLSLRGPHRLSHSDIIAVLWEMIFRGTDTVAVLIEWILARMVLHPDVQSKVQGELDAVVGSSRAVTVEDVAAMSYLPAVVKEVLRLHPPGPLLSWARLSISDTTVDGYHVPAGTTAMVNMWAISRDPHVWRDPLEFMPERFITSSSTARGGDAEFSVLGSDLRLAPFGSGKRACPGRTLGLATVSFWVASLLHEYEWLPSDERSGVVDLSEVLRLSCEMANPLTVKVRPRRSTTNFST